MTHDEIMDRIIDSPCGFSFGREGEEVVVELTHPQNGALITVRRRTMQAAALAAYEQASARWKCMAPTASPPPTTRDRARPERTP